MEAINKPSSTHSQACAYGHVVLNKILWIFGPVTIFLPCYSYYMAFIVEKSVKPLPNSCITDNADQYPQNIAFHFLSGFDIASLVLLFLRSKEMDGLPSIIFKISQNKQILLLIYAVWSIRLLCNNRDAS